jgi:hypothetical protein
MAFTSGNSTAVTRMPFTLRSRARFAACVKLVISSFANFAITFTLSSLWLFEIPSGFALPAD